MLSLKNIRTLLHGHSHIRSRLTQTVSTRARPKKTFSFQYMRRLICVAFKDNPGTLIESPSLQRTHSAHNPFNSNPTTGHAYQLPATEPTKMSHIIASANLFSRGFLKIAPYCSIGPDLSHHLILKVKPDKIGTSCNSVSYQASEEDI